MAIPPEVPILATYESPQILAEVPRRQLYLPGWEVQKSFLSRGAGPTWAECGQFSLGASQIAVS